MRKSIFVVVLSLALFVGVALTTADITGGSLDFAFDTVVAEASNITTMHPCIPDRPERPNLPTIPDPPDIPPFDGQPLHDCSFVGPE